eukprot:TRINITY_DN1150_c0_g1_i1.p1 TRINITY_DN1150_c0_g1~~TRINITY_DN1150_c0_g1_i1.p1  ORF type:complete len:291 (+),score=35.89 TRINITY_DN1150_c0_g1_i1:53-925(+)
MAESSNPWSGNDPNARHQSSSHDESQPFLQGNQALLGDRPKNWPRCRPIIHHRIHSDIVEEKRTMVRRAYFGWWMHSICLLWNFIAMCAALAIKEANWGDFFISLAALILGTPVSFWVYWLFYSAVRKGSGANYTIWFCSFFLEIAFEILCAVGIPSTGAAGFILMVNAFKKPNVPIGILNAVSAAFWIGVVVYNIIIFNSGRRDYREVGGNKAAAREFGKAAVTVAYDNRDTIKQIAKDNKETIKRVAVENQDVIVDFAKENRGAIAKAVVNNKDVIYEHRDAVGTVFN